MESTPKPAPRNTSRTVVMAVVGVLIVVAIAGIVLAGRKAKEPPVQPVASVTPAPAEAPTAASSVAAADPEPLPSDIRFTDGSDRLPAGAHLQITRLADAARAGGQSIALTSRFQVGPDRTKASALARTRLEMVQHAFQSNGVPASRLRGEMIEVPVADSNPESLDRVEIRLH